MSNKILLVGAGYMGQEYARVLKAFKISFTTIGRGEKSAKEFEDKIKKSVITGGLKNFKEKYPEKAIIAVDEAQAGKVARDLIQGGVKSILVEKPGGLNKIDIVETAKLAKSRGAKICIAYNRRFYASVEKARQIIKKDGGVLSFNFDFTEWIHRIPEELKNRPVGKKWFLANSTHLIDMAFFLGGKPKKLYTYNEGGLKWHPRASIYAGAGLSEAGALFSYHANWESAGRWWIEINTKKRKIIFRPLEQLKIQRIGSVTEEEVKIDDRLDTKYKAGVYKQVQAWLENKKDLMMIGEQVKAFQYYELINK